MLALSNSFLNVQKRELKLAIVKYIQQTPYIVVTMYCLNGVAKVKYMYLEVTRSNNTSWYYIMLAHTYYPRGSLIVSTIIKWLYLGNYKSKIRAITYSKFNRDQQTPLKQSTIICNINDHNAYERKFKWMENNSKTWHRYNIKRQSLRVTEAILERSEWSWPNCTYHVNLNGMWKALIYPQQAGFVY